jgi:FlaA1/EpsC-like NDP-sugar epimerase
MRLRPRQVILLDSSEGNLNEIDLDLAGEYGRDLHTAVLGDICDTTLLGEIFQRYNPKLVFHAAAFKHVPLMENNPFAAVRNNALGTDTLARMCQAERVSSLVMISTDKAVNPISIMGASKRVAELALLNLNHSRTRLSAVRLGNVLGSQGSVLPAFLNQISRGGPVTVTHPEVSRYFLNIDEAVELILLASAVQETGGIFIPQLGAPLKILDLARETIRNTQSDSQQEVPLVFTGLRAGDKMSEEFLHQNEVAEPTVDPRLFHVVSEAAPRVDFEIQMKALARSVERRDLTAMIETLCHIVPAYQPTKLLRRAAAASAV